MSQKFLYDPDVFSIFEEPGRKRMAQRIELHRGNATFLETSLEGPVKVSIFDTPAGCGSKNIIIICVLIPSQGLLLGLFHSVKSECHGKPFG